MKIIYVVCAAGNKKLCVTYFIFTIVMYCRLTVHTSSGADDFFGGYTMYLFDRTMRTFLFICKKQQPALLLTTNTISHPLATYGVDFFQSKVFLCLCYANCCHHIP